MAIERRGGSNGAIRTVTTACPFCDEPLPRQVGLASHLRTTDGCEANGGSGEVVNE